MQDSLNEKKEKLKEIIDLFKYNIKQYKSNRYDEANTRIDFIDKFFELLDWDVRNTQGFPEQYREVVREDKIIIEGKQKAPDYSFRIGKGQRVFFVEAKKPSVNIKEEIKPAFQTRRYSYTAKLPLSILTDFEEIAVYDTRIKPNKNDNASTARIFFCTFDNLLKSIDTKKEETNFDFLYNTFSKTAIHKGSFDKYIEENKNKKGTSEVDKEFLKLIEDWRNELAKNIALRNIEIDIYNLNSAIQKIIDKVIFLRIAEDRKMEPYGKLKKLTKENDIYKKLIDVFKKANDKYNSGLFQEEEWLNNLIIDDRVLISIINELYYPSPYEFSVMPIEILGHVYEQFLGKTIRFTQSHQAKVEEKPEVRKAGGVYYTPQYIVNYIVENTVGEKIKNKKPEDITQIKILDPACGSGSFLVGAYTYLLNYHLEYYTKEQSIKKALKEGKIYQIDEKTYHLSTGEKHKILVNNIYGVDIDNQAVEVTKLSLLLKLLEDENIEAEGELFSHTDVKLLPDLSNNIKYGNSLIGNDFYQDKNMSKFDKEEMRKINAFDWNGKNGFPKIMGAGGFDVVIGNPPYGAELSNDERKYLENKYKLSNTDTACLFMGHSIKIINNHGINGFIIPKPFIYSSNWKVIRELLLNNLSEIVDCGKVWIQVKLEQVIYFYNNKSILNNYISSVRNKERIINLGKIEKTTFQRFGFYLNGISSKELKIGEKILETGNFLNDFIVNQRGAPYQQYVSEVRNEYKVLGGKQLNRYYLIDDVKGFLSKKNISDDKAYIKENSILVQNLVAHIQNPIDHIKIIATIINNESRNDFIILDTINQLSIKNNFSSKYILGILNAKLLSWYCYRFIFGKAIRTMHFDNAVTSRIPYPRINLNSNKEKSHHDFLTLLVDQMLKTQNQFHNAKTENDKKIYKQKIDILDKQIDDLVYELYGLTEEEIKIIEESV